MAVGIRRRLMNILRGLPPESKYSQTTVTAIDLYGEGRRDAAESRLIAERYKNLWAYKFANMNADAVSSVPLRVYTLDDSGGYEGRKRRVKSLAHAGNIVRKIIGDAEGVVEIEDESHPAVGLLARVNPYMEGHEFIYAAQLSYETDGNVFIYMERAERDAVPDRLWVLQPQYVRVVPDKEHVISGYAYGRDPRDEAWFEPWEIAHSKRYSPLDPLRGMGPLESAVSHVDLETEIHRFQRRWIENGCEPGLILNVSSKGGRIAARELESLERKLNRKFSGAERAGASMVLQTEEMQVERVAPGPEMPKLMAAEHLRDIIASAFGVPRSKVTSDDVNLANSRTGHMQYQRDTVMPRCRRLEDAINEYIMPAFRRELGDETLCVMFDNPVDRDAEGDANLAVSLYQGGLVTRNEARGLAGYDADDGGDEYLAPVPAADPGAGAPAPLTIPRVSWDEPEPAGGDEPAIDEHKIKCCGHKHKNGVTVSQKSMIFSGDVPLIRKVKRTEGERKLERFLADYFDRAVGGFAREHTNENGELTLGIADSPELRQRFDDGVREVAETLFLEGWEASGAPRDGPASDQVDAALESLERYQARLRDDVLSAADEKVRAALEDRRNAIQAVADGLAEGSSIPDIVDVISGVTEDLSTHAAERIAVTESRRAVNEGLRSGWDTMGSVVGVRWLLSGNPCPVCEAIAARGNAKKGEPFLKLGQTIATADGAFTADYTDIYGPPAHPFCRCASVAVFADEAEK